MKITGGYLYGKKDLFSPGITTWKMPAYLFHVPSFIYRQDGYELSHYI
jgi:hypothetical protein